MAIPRAKKAKKKNVASGKYIYTEEDMEQRVTSAQEVYKSIIFLYLAQNRKWKQEGLMQLDKQFARNILGLYNGWLTFEDLQNLLEKHGVDMKAIGESTQAWLDKYGREWGLGKK